jgi:hypothetical protein
VVAFLLICLPVVLLTAAYYLFARLGILRHADRAVEITSTTVGLLLVLVFLGVVTNGFGHLQLAETVSRLFHWLHC